MTAQAMRTVLSSQKPPVVDSAYAQAQRYGVNQETARTILVECGYVNTGKRWERIPSQDEIQFRMVSEMYEYFTEYVKPLQRETSHVHIEDTPMQGIAHPPKIDSYYPSEAELDEMYAKGKTWDDEKNEWVIFADVAS